MKYDGTLTADSVLPVLKPNGEIDFGVGEDETPFGEGADHELFSRIRSSRRGFSEETLLPYRQRFKIVRQNVAAGAKASQEPMARALAGTATSMAKYPGCRTMR
jgi:hypothetical protein